VRLIRAAEREELVRLRREALEVMRPKPVKVIAPNGAIIDSGNSAMAPPKELTASNEPLRWFSGRSERRCPACDGQLDRKPLEALLKSTAERLKAAIQGREGL
jgi:hypothetical protein